jgi:hypothetical protein
MFCFKMYLVYLYVSEFYFVIYTSGTNSNGGDGVEHLLDVKNDNVVIDDFFLNGNGRC